LSKRTEKAMKKLYFTAAACCALIGPAAAADVPPPVYKNAPAATSAITWTGCYAGGNIGGVVGNYNNNWTPNAAGFPISGVDLTSIGSGALNSQGVTAGGQAGCNHQIGEFAVGVEGDFAWSQRATIFSDRNGEQQLAWDSSWPLRVGQ
jgi:outer membrane immunogenic protein